MTRRILLTLADDTTATECGACPMLDHAIDWCGSFAIRLVDAIQDSDEPGYRHLRHRECIAAEAAAARMVEPLPAGDAEHVGRDIWERGTDDGGAAERLHAAIRKLLGEP